MTELETIMNNLENLGAAGDESKEFVGTTEVCNFEGCGLLSNEQLANYLNETLPPSHLEGCPSITFDPNNREFILSSNTLGFYECGSHAIHIADETRFSEGSEGVIDTVTHEVGHNAYAEVIETNSGLEAKWQALNAESWQELQMDGTGFVSDYAMTNKYEDFAESYRAYVRDPEMLQVLSPDKYSFLRDYVFAGREYQPTIMAYWDYDSNGNKIEVTSTGVYDLSGNRIAWSL